MFIKICFKLFSLIVLTASPIMSFYSNAQISINEIQASNQTTIADNFLDYDDWIELYNTTNNAIDLAGYFLSDDVNSLIKYEIPNTNAAATTIASNGYLLFWADNEIFQGENHTNFKLSSSGETVYLIHPDGATIVDSLTYLPIIADETYKRIPDGGNNLIKSTIASPTSTNNNDLVLLDAPIFSTQSGVYTTSQTLTLSSAAGATIHYTTDGSEPNINSAVYSAPITINQNTSVKAIAIDAQNNQSKVALGSYILNSTTALPILHVVVDPFYLYDDSLGMYVVGTNGIAGPCHSDLRNWSQDWRYEANVVLYEKDRTIDFEEGCGLEISGGCSRNSPKKSFNVSFRSNYGTKKINYKLFDSKEETEWYGFKVRRAKVQNSSSDNFNQKLIEHQLDVDMQSARPVALYLNNEYWGLYFIKERMNKGYIKTYHPKVDTDSIDLIKFPKADGVLADWIMEEVKEGTNVAYHALENFMMQNPLSIQSNYEYVKTQIDISSFLDYFCTQIYYNTGDWPGNNLKVWRPTDQSGKWRWMMFDIESSHWNGGAANTYYLSYFFDANSPNAFANYAATRPFRLLLGNDEFKHEFIQRINTYTNTLWDTMRVNTVLNAFKNEIRTEIQADYLRWSAEETNSLDSLTWETASNNLYNFFLIRPDSMRATIDYTLNTSGRVELSFNTSPATNGAVNLHTNFFKLPYNYTGIYHKDVPLDIHAVPKPGYRFSHWLETGNTNSSLYQSFSSNTTFTPIFEPAQDLVINEIHYNPLGTLEEEEFIELYNPDSKAKPLYGYQFNNGVEFTFPENAVINPNEYIIIAKDAALYSGNGYQVFQWECGSLNNDGEKIFFSNAAEIVIDSVLYNDNIDWDQNADGLGYSLALIDHTQDNYQSTAWASQPVDQITPGAENDFCIPITNNPLIADISCFEANDGFITTQVNGGTPPFVYSWNNGSTSNIIDNLAQGQYTVSITDFYNCTHTETFNISEPTALIRTVFSTDQTYYNVNDGTASISVSGGIAPYTYSWSNGLNTSSINNLTPGTYIVDVKDVNGCSLNDDVTINAVACTNLNVTVSTQHESCFNENDGLLQITNIQNGIAPYSILWSTGITGTVTNNLSGGTYQLSITDELGCPFDETYTINTASSLLATEVIANTTTSNSNDGAIDLTVVGGAPPYSFYWSNASTTEDVSGLSEANYWVSIIDANDCQLLFNNLQVGTDCPVSIVHQNYPTLISNTYQVVNFIQSNGMVNLAEQVSFKAGNYIELNNNFEVVQGADFEVLIDDCE